MGSFAGVGVGLVLPAWREGDCAFPGQVEPLVSRSCLSEASQIRVLSSFICLERAPPDQSDTCVALAFGVVKLLLLDLGPVRGVTSA